MNYYYGYDSSIV